VLLFEIELEIRDLLRDLHPGEALHQLMMELSDASGEPEVQAAEALKELLDESDPLITDRTVEKKVSFAIGQLTKAAKQKARGRSVRALEDFTFAQYRGVIFDADRWPRFEPIFSQPREILSLDFERINELRNDVFHFRRSIGPRDTDRLRRFRDKLRYDRGLMPQPLRPSQQPDASGHATAAMGTRRPR
jgi:hypothetical protein